MENFYPISLSTPVAALLIGGLRYYENIILWSLSLGIEPEVYVVTRKYLSNAWNSINKSLLRYLGFKFDLKFIGTENEIPSGNSLIISTSLPPSIELLNDLMGKLNADTVITCNGNAILGIMRNGEFKDSINYCTDKRLDGIWSVIKLNTELLGTNINHLIRLIGNKVLDSDVDHGAVINEDRGPVLIIKSVIEPLTYIRGPALMGPGARILPHAYVREGSVFYMDNAVGGEVKNSVMDHDSLKEHLGYLGDSYVGRWVNLGAGSVTSNLKNTIGMIRYAGRDTGMTKLGSVIGDWGKVGINTSIMSGKFIGQGSSVVGLIRRDVPPFSMCVNDECEDYLLDKAMEVYRRFAKLRHKNPSEAEEELIKEVYGLRKFINSP